MRSGKKGSLHKGSSLLRKKERTGRGLLLRAVGIGKRKTNFPLSYGVGGPVKGRGGGEREGVPRLVQLEGGKEAIFPRKKRGQRGHFIPGTRANGSPFYCSTRSKGKRGTG